MSVTAAEGFVASGVEAGIRRSGLDLALVRSLPPAVGGAVWTTNRVQAALGLLGLSAGDDVVRLAPPLTIGTDEVDEELCILAAVLDTPESEAKVQVVA